MSEFVASPEAQEQSAVVNKPWRLKDKCAFLHFPVDWKMVDNKTIIQ